MPNLGKKLTEYLNLVKYYYWTAWNGELPEIVLSEGTNAMVVISGDRFVLWTARGWV